jgi:hypothetical protein
MMDDLTGMPSSSRRSRGPACAALHAHLSLCICALRPAYAIVCALCRPPATSPLLHSSDTACPQDTHNHSSHGTAHAFHSAAVQLHPIVLLTQRRVQQRAQVRHSAQPAARRPSPSLWRCRMRQEGQLAQRPA